MLRDERARLALEVERLEVERLDVDRLARAPPVDRLGLVPDADRLLDLARVDPDDLELERDRLLEPEPEPREPPLLA